MGKIWHYVLIVVYMLLFAVSMYAVFNVRNDIINFKTNETSNRYMVVIGGDGYMSEAQFLVFKLTVFYVTAFLSLLLMFSNYYLYKTQKPNLTKEMDKEVEKELKKRVELMKFKKELDDVKEN